MVANKSSESMRGEGGGETREARHKETETCLDRWGVEEGLLAWRQSLLCTHGPCEVLALPGAGFRQGSL